jgi:Spy/CpxP family protein refolding chaperone
MGRKRLCLINGNCRSKLEGWMKLAFVVTAVLMFPLMAAAQTDVTVAPGTNSKAGVAAPGFSLPGGFTPPAGLFEQFWNDPACAAELHLTDAQRKQLQDAALTQQLSLIDGGADGLKTLARLSALLNADQLDEAAYKQQLSNLAAATGKVVQGVGEMAVEPRRVLTAEQWHKLQSLQRAKRTAIRSAAPSHQSATHTPAGDKP